MQEYVLMKKLPKTYNGGYQTPNNHTMTCIFQTHRNQYQLIPLHMDGERRRVTYQQEAS